jgi:hypothetical protein
MPLQDMRHMTVEEIRLLIKKQGQVFISVLQNVFSPYHVMYVIGCIIVDVNNFISSLESDKVYLNNILAMAHARNSLFGKGINITRLNELLKGVAEGVSQEVTPSAEGVQEAVTKEVTEDVSQEVTPSAAQEVTPSSDLNNLISRDARFQDLDRVYGSILKREQLQYSDMPERISDLAELCFYYWILVAYNASYDRSNEVRYFLRSYINQNPNIPEDQKPRKFMERCRKRANTHVYRLRIRI